MKIHIEQLSFEAIIGLLDFERHTPQRVVVDIEAKYSYKNKSFINYAELSTLIKKLITEQKFKLLEEALLALEEIIKEHYPTIERLKIKIAKPDILSDCTVALSKEWNYQLS
ncbi:MAG TPA: dihydroneopterin aldolase [Nitratifractor sp.]|nr:dihydroneopterin aldolase [Nitratifractor sp.]HHD74800.1 dihydroneopterin aldolase [Nitratifractor sp.]HHH20959.1 dihydroneopterin aldolase [Nitratifractor sp.]